MRTTAFPMLLASAAGCLDLNALQSGDEMGTMPKDMAMPGDGSLPKDLRPLQDMTPPPVHWTQVYTATGNPLNAITGFNAGTTNTLYAAGSPTAVKGDGATFQPSAFSPGTGSVNGLWAASASMVYAVDGGGKIWQTTDGGSSAWTDTMAGASNAQQAIYGRGPSDILATGLDKKFGYYFTTSWSQVQHNVNQLMYGVFATAAKWYVVGSSGGAAFVADPTKGWTAKTVGGNPNLRGIWAADDANVWAVGMAGAIDKFDGNAWTKMDQGTNDLAAIWGASATDIIAVGAKGTVYHYDGNQWKSDGNPALSNVNLTGVWGDAKGNVWAVGNDLAGTNGAIYKY